MRLNLRGIIHRIAAVLMIVASFYHLFYIIFTKRGRKLVADLWFYKKDLTDLLESIGYITWKSKRTVQDSEDSVTLKKLNTGL